MKMNKFATVFFASILALSFAGCKKNQNTKTASETEKQKIKVVATIFPEYDWVKNLIEGSDSFELELLAKNGADLHSYQPSTADIVKIASSDLFIYVGGESDFWVSQVIKNSNNKNQFTVNLMEILAQNVKEEETVEGMQSHEENDGHEEDKIEYDEHVWLSVKNAKIAVIKIAEYLEVLDLANSSVYAKNLQNYLKKLDSLSEIALELSKKNDFSSKPLIVCDRFPFRYMTDELGAKYFAAFSGCSAETEASFETVAFLSKKVQEFEEPRVFVTENSDKKIAKTVIKNAGFDGKCEIFVIDSMQSATFEQIKAGKNYIDIMKENYEKLNFFGKE